VDRVESCSEATISQLTILKTNHLITIKHIVPLIIMTTPITLIIFL
jgi:hypothetical protein